MHDFECNEYYYDIVYKGIRYRVVQSGHLTSDEIGDQIHSENWTLPDAAAANLTLEVVGCRDPPQTWCTKVGRIFLPQYIVAQYLLHWSMYRTVTLLVECWHFIT